MRALFERESPQPAKVEATRHGRKTNTSVSGIHRIVKTRSSVTPRMDGTALMIESIRGGERLVFLGAEDERGRRARLAFVVVRASEVDRVLDHLLSVKRSRRREAPIAEVRR
jgi:hypothetical protein